MRNVLQMSENSTARGRGNNIQTGFEHPPNAFQAQSKDGSSTRPPLRPRSWTSFRQNRKTASASTRRLDYATPASFSDLRNKPVTGSLPGCTSPSPPHEWTASSLRHISLEDPSDLIMSRYQMPF